MVERWESESASNWLRVACRAVAGEGGSVESSVKAPWRSRSWGWEPPRPPVDRLAVARRVPPGANWEQQSKAEKLKH